MYYIMGFAFVILLLAGLANQQHEDRFTETCNSKNGHAIEQLDGKLVCILPNNGTYTDSYTPD